MPLLKPFLFAAAMAMPTPWSSNMAEETDEDRSARVTVITDALGDECPEPWLAIAALVKMHAESGGFRLDVHDGRRRGDQGRSVCLGQIWGGGDKLVGTSVIKTRLCVRTTVRHLGYHFVRCGFRNVNQWTVAGTYAGYGTGHSCNPRFIHKDTGRPFGLDRSRAWGALWRAFNSPAAETAGIVKAAYGPTVGIGWLDLRLVAPKLGVGTIIQLEGTL